MELKNESDYYRVADAIEFIQKHYKEQPSLALIASQVGLSPSHFQRMFTRWAGVSPKKFTQFLTLEYAKSVLLTEQASLLDTAYEVGLSGSSRLHDLFISIEAMTPGEFKRGGENLGIQYDCYHSLFGRMMVASTSKGVCFLSFFDEKQSAIQSLSDTFPNATLINQPTPLHQSVLSLFQGHQQPFEHIKLHLKGTDFQLKVWQALLNIPMGALTHYSVIATDIDQPKAVRAVGTAIGRNPVALLIPCHRVIQSSGGLGGYRWGKTRKSALIGWEASQVDRFSQSE